MSRRRTQSAFTLVEVLVTVIILAIGILGLAGLQIAGMRSNHSAFLRTQATLAASDLMDRMRADPAAVVGLTLNTTESTGVELFDRWGAELARWLPAPGGGVQRGTMDCGTGNACGNGNCAVIIRWDDARAELDGATATTSGRDATRLEFQACTRLPERS